MHYDPAVWCLMAVAVLLAAIVQSAMGFGFALVAMAILPFVVGIQTAHLVVSVIAGVPMVIALRTCWRDVPWSAQGWCLVGAAVMLPIGIGVFAYVSADFLMRLTGSVILLLAADGLLRPDQTGVPLKRMRLWSMIAGGCSGFLAGSVSVGGPPVVIFAARQGWKPAVFKAFVLTFLLIQVIAKVIMMQASHMLTAPIWHLALLAGPLAIVGGEIGSRASAYLSGPQFRRLTLLLLIIIGALMIVRGAPS